MFLRWYYDTFLCAIGDRIIGDRSLVTRAGTAERRRRPGPSWTLRQSNARDTPRGRRPVVPPGRGSAVLPTAPVRGIATPTDIGRTRTQHGTQLVDLRDLTGLDAMRDYTSQIRPGVIGSATAMQSRPTCTAAC